jgi:endoglucanase
MRVTIDNTKAPWDKSWHHVRMPFSSFTEQGSWDNNNWFNPEGKFDWKAIDRMEIVAEHEALTGKSFWFDNIHITNKDTAIVRENSIISKREEINDRKTVFVYPNPMSEVLHIAYQLTNPELTRIEVFTMAGKKVFEKVEMQSAGNHIHIWKGRDLTGNTLPPGLYLLNITFGKTASSFKISVNTL